MGCLYTRISFLPGKSFFRGMRERYGRWFDARRFRSVPRSSPGLNRSPGDFFFVFPFSQLKPAFGYCPCRKDLTCTQESNLFHYLGSCGLIRRFENLSSTRMCNSNEGRPNLLPFSRRWYSGPCPYAVASRSCWAVWAKERRSSDVIE